MRESTTNLVNLEGKSEVSYEYTYFGETEINGDENFYNEMCYTGGIYDNKTGMYYLNARYYNPEDGRFLTEETYSGELTDPSGHFPILLAFDAAWGAYDGYQYVKRKKLTGWRRAGAIVGGAVLGTINLFKKLKVGKVFKRVAKIAKKRKGTRAIVERVYGVVRKSKSVKRKVRKKATRTYRRVKCKITKKGCFTAGTLISTQDGDVPEEGDVVVLQSGDRSTVEKIDKVVHNELITVYNFEVEDFHTYFVSDASVLVHNDYSGVRRKGASRKAKKYAGISKSQKPLGSKRNQMNQPKNPTYQRVRNTSTSISGRKYSGHALDRMQDRGIMPSVIENTIKYGSITPRGYGGKTQYYDSVNNVSVVLNEAGKVITVSYGK